MSSQTSNDPSGAVIIATSGLIFAAALIFSPKRRVKEYSPIAATPM